VFEEKKDESLIDAEKCILPFGFKERESN